MKIYQCIHKYGPHIKPFEKRWGIGDHSSFSEIHRALMLDGYACVYRLVPPPERPDDSVFFTVWNYERLQRAWARENDIGATTLDEIRLAQIELMKPDVVYDFSSFVSPSFASKLRAVFAGLIIAWNGVIKGEDPPADTAYDGYASLHRPFVKSWKKRGLPALELQPGVEPEWGDLEVRPFAQRKEELIIYGQLGVVSHHVGQASSSLSRC